MLQSCHSAVTIWKRMDKYEPIVKYTAQNQWMCIIFYRPLLIEQVLHQLWCKSSRRSHEDALSTVENTFFTRPPSTRYFVIIPWSWFKIIGGCYSSDFSEIDDTYDKILFVIVKGDLYSSIKGLHSLAYYLTYFLPSLSAIFSACAFRLFMCCTQASCWVLCRGVFLLWHKKKRLRIKLMRKPFLFNFE